MYTLQYLKQLACVYTVAYTLYMGTCICIGVLIVFTMFGNSLVLLCFCMYSEQFKGSYYIMIRHLALTDRLFWFASRLFTVDFAFSELEGNITLCVVRKRVTSFNKINVQLEKNKSAMSPCRLCFLVFFPFFRIF